MPTNNSTMTCECNALRGHLGAAACIAAIAAGALRDIAGIHGDCVDACTYEDT